MLKINADNNDKLGGEVIERPVTFSEVNATFYHVIGIDPNTSTG